MMACVCALVLVIQHGSCCGCCAASPRNEKTGKGCIRMLFDQQRKVDRLAIEPRRGAGLQPPDRQLQLAQACRQRNRRGVTHTTAGIVRQADVNQAVEKGAGRQDHRASGKAHAELGHHASNVIAVHHQIVTRLGEDRQIRLVLQAAPYRLPVQHAIRLRARCAHRRTLARIENPELDARFIGGLGHGSPQGIDFLDQMPLADAADRWIAAHRTQRFQVVRQQQRLASHARCSQRRLGAGMAATDDDDVETVRKEHKRRAFSAR
jgi:hypothetical protein